MFGFGVLETNPVFQFFDNGFIFLGLAIAIYIFFFVAWFQVNKLQRLAHKTKYKYYKLFDLFLFIFCFMIIFVTMIKINMGINNITIMTEYITTEGKLKYTNLIEEHQLLKETDLVQYKSLSQNYYFEVLKVNYSQMLLIMIFSFLLFNIGNKVTPWDIN